MKTKELNEMLESALLATIDQYAKADSTLFAITCRKDSEEQDSFQGDCYFVGKSWKLAEGFFQLLNSGFSDNADSDCYGVAIAFMLGMQKMLESDCPESLKLLKMIMNILTNLEK